MRALWLSTVLFGVVFGCAGPAPTYRISAPEDAVTRAFAVAGSDAPLQVKTWLASGGDEVDDDVDETAPAGAEGPVVMRAVATATPDTYGGTCRKIAKISIPELLVEPFPNLPMALASLTPDSEMAGLGISRSATSARVRQEDHVVSFPCYVLATNKPRDNDYHVIVGDHPTAPSVVINVEVSGLPEFPRDDDFTTQAMADALGRVRDTYQAGLGDDLPSGSSYRFFSPGLPVRVTGAVYWDSCHSIGQVGPAGLKPQTNWELHPVTAIEFVTLN